MKAQRLTLSNYRGFPKLDLEIGSHVTVLAGVNGSGKSAILRALASVLSHLLPEVTPSKEKPEALTAGEFHVGKPALTISGTFAEEKRVLHAQLTRGIPDPEKASEYAERRDQARFAIRETRKGSKEEMELQEEIRYLSALLEQDHDHFSFQVEAQKSQARATKVGGKGHPIAILYATSRYLGRLAPHLSGMRAFEPGNAYAGRLGGTEVSLAAFANWFHAAIQGALGSRTASNRILRLLNTVVTKLLPGFSDPRLAAKPRPRFFVKKDAIEFELQQLSDGERGLLALAFDLTRRLAIANPGLTNPVAEGRAIVLLDEVELHLHPSWQRKVLGRLVETFKNCQFIATTHSPQVLGEAPPGSVWMVEREGEQMVAWQPDRTFGMDSNRLLEELMGTDALNTKVKGKLHQISLLVDKDKFNKAEQAIAGLESKLGVDHPELIRLRALIAFVTGKK